ncbi:MAG: hypothetical protein M3O70_05820 [Actinomycetota bacterium]|nr:hypothetical protein [Actinomycetota bacterium]
MSNENARRSDNLSDEGTAVVWEEQTDLDIDECRHGVCRNVEVNVGLQGLVEDVTYSAGIWTPTFEAPSRGNPSVGNDLRAAWRTKLEREGKLDSKTTSVRRVVSASSEAK